MKLRLLLTYVFILTATFSMAQKKSYQGLLWEITGNGLETPSYLYGTMHVANKLAFNVSDSFYICLNKAEAIALESAPTDWIEGYRDRGAFSGGNYSYDGFYEKAFKIKEVRNEFTPELMQNNNRLMNQILYRFSSGGEDYQENTYLDMFIFQAGAKNNKPIYSLETLREVLDLQIKALTPDKDKEEDNSRNNYLDSDGERKMTLLKEAYRRGDLNQIDSLSKADPPTSVYHDYFIVERNKNMIRRVDSILNINSLFIGIGAAHLPGEFGAIELLRNLGYTLRAVNPKITGKAKKMRVKLEELYKTVDMKTAKTGDDFINVSVPNKLYQMPVSSRGKLEYVSPDHANGGYYSITRLFTYGTIFGKTPEDYMAIFDSLAYISTPGDAIKQERISANGYPGYRILTRTSKNAIVNYNIFFTPTEIVAFKGFGIGDYIQKSDPKRFFSEIQLGKANSEWHDVKPKFGGAKWKMKGLVTGSDMIDWLNNTNVEPTYQSYDNSNGDYYLVMRYTYNDLDFIEEDSFDLAYMGESVGKKLGYEIDQTTFYQKTGYSYVEQKLTADEDHPKHAKALQLKIITQGGYYYLMTTTAGPENTRAFFNSFAFENFNVTDEYRVYEDTNLYYTVETIKEEELPQLPSSFGYGSITSDEDKTYLSANKRNYHSLAKTGEGIYVGYIKYHNYDGAISEEDFWKVRTERLTDENGLIVSNRVAEKVDNDLTLRFTLTDTNSSKGIMTLLYLHHGVQYTVQALIDTATGPSPYVKRFFETFTPMDTLIGRDIFEDKAEVFFEHVNGTDSLNKVNAMKSISTVDFEEKDVAGIINVYRTFEFEEETEQEYREDLIMTLGNIEVQEAYDFLNEVYNENNFNSDLQFIALKCFSYTETEEAYASIKSQLLGNPPFTEKNSKLLFFDNLYDSLELAKGYYPEMLEMVQYSDYHPYVMELLANGYLKEIFTYENFKDEKSAIFRNAKIELKRTVAAQATSKSSSKSSYGYGNYNTVNQYSPYHSLFLDYYTLMCGFREAGDPEAEDFFKDIYRIEDQKFKVEAEIIHYKLGLPVDTAQINSVSRDVKYRVWVYNRLEDNEMLAFLDPAITQEDMAFSLLYFKGYDAETDSVAFVKTVYINNGIDTGVVYFFKRKQENKKNWMIDYVGLQPNDDTLYTTYGLISKKGLSIKNEEEMEATIERTIEVFELQHRKRVVLGTGSGLFY